MEWNGEWMNLNDDIINLIQKFISYFRVPLPILQENTKGLDHHHLLPPLMKYIHSFFFTIRIFRCICSSNNSQHLRNIWHIRWYIQGQEESVKMSFIVTPLANNLTVFNKIFNNHFFIVQKFSRFCDFKSHRKADRSRGLLFNAVFLFHSALQRFKFYVRKLSVGFEWIWIFFV